MNEVQIQFPEIIEARIIGKKDIIDISDCLRFRLKRLNINQNDISKHLLGDRKQIDLMELKVQLEK